MTVVNVGVNADEAEDNVVGAVVEEEEAVVDVDECDGKEAV